MQLNFAFQIAVGSNAVGVICFQGSSLRCIAEEEAAIDRKSCVLFESKGIFNLNTVTDTHITVNDQIVVRECRVNILLSVKLTGIHRQQCAVSDVGNRFRTFIDQQSEVLTTVVDIVESDISLDTDHVDHTVVSDDTHILELNITFIDLSCISRFTQIHPLTVGIKVTDDRFRAFHSFKGIAVVRNTFSDLDILNIDTVFFDRFVEIPVFTVENELVITGGIFRSNQFLIIAAETDAAGKFAVQRLSLFKISIGIPDITGYAHGEILFPILVEHKEVITAGDIDFQSLDNENIIQITVNNIPVRRDDKAEVTAFVNISCLTVIHGGVRGRDREGIIRFTRCIGIDLIGIGRTGKGDRDLIAGNVDAVPTDIVAIGIKTGFFSAGDIHLIGAIQQFPVVVPVLDRVFSVFGDPDTGNTVCGNIFKMEGTDAFNINIRTAVSFKHCVLTDHRMTVDRETIRCRIGKEAVGRGISLKGQIVISTADDLQTGKFTINVPMTIDNSTCGLTDRIDVFNSAIELEGEITGKLIAVGKSQRTIDNNTAAFVNLSALALTFDQITELSVADITIGKCQTVIKTIKDSGIAAIDDRAAIRPLDAVAAAVRFKKFCSVGLTAESHGYTLIDRQQGIQSRHAVD